MKKIPRGWLLASALVCMSFAAFAQTAAADTQHFAFTGFEQTYLVPDRVHSVHVVAVGGRGGVGSDDLIGAMTFHGGLAGFGDRLEADLAVTPGQALFIEVGGNGQDGVRAIGGAGGYNGGGTSFGDVFNRAGGGGGGGTDVRTCSIFAVNCVGTPNTLSSRVLVAGGGGGGGALGRALQATGGGGGDAGMSGQAGQPVNAGTPAGGGGQGTQASGGAGGSPGLEGEAAGDSGVLAIGGASPAAGANAGARGGGGGGGFFGGGGGGSGGGAGGGGGGSSFFGLTASNVSSHVDSTGISGVTITSGDPDPVPGPKPPTDFGVGHLTLNKHRGTGVLSIEVPAAGHVTLLGRGLATSGPVAFGASGEVKLNVRASGKAKRRLCRRGALTLNATVTYIPTGGAAINKVAGIVLVRRR